MNDKIENKVSEGEVISGPRPQKRRRRLLVLSFIIAVLIPTILGGYYYNFVASDRYTSSAGFAVRGVSAGASIDGIGALTGLASSGTTTSDSYIILKYLESRDLVEKLEAEIDLAAVYSGQNIDSYSRMGKNLTIEEFVKYWESMIFTTFDSTSGVLTFEVQAFTPEDAKQIAELVLENTQDLVNSLSERARQDSVRFADAEVKRAEERLRKALSDLREFRQSEQSINPAASAQLDMELISTLESRLLEVKARIAALGDSVAIDAPSMIRLRGQAEALEEQIKERTAELGSSVAGQNGTDISELLAVYEALEVEKTFAEQAYASSLSSLEQARIEADRQQRYLAVYSLPLLAQEAVYPERLLNTLLVIVIAVCFWGISTLIVYSIRDHLS